MLKGFLENLSSIINVNKILPKILITIVILVGVVVVIKFIKAALSRWHKKFIDKLQIKNPASIASVETKIIITRKIINICIYFFAIIFFLLQFEAVRNIGTGLLASAGIVGLIVGMAAQNTLSNIIAGIHISFAQPVRLNVAVILR